MAEIEAKVVIACMTNPANGGKYNISVRVANRHQGKKKAISNHSGHSKVTGEILRLYADL